jgi:acyl-CoA synthetase (NDP forming)
MVEVFFVTAPFVDQAAIAARLREATAGASKPVAVVVETLDAASPLIAELRAAGLPCYELPEDGVRALAAAALARAFVELRERFADEDTSFILLEQRRAGRELVAGATAAPGVGALAMFGLGGVFVEALHDVAFGLAPLGRLEARAMIHSLRAERVLEGVPGHPGVDLAAVENLLLRVSRLAADFPEIVELDLNPILA